jgi:alpha-glucuronidase
MREILPGWPRTSERRANFAMLALVLTAAVIACPAARAEDGYDLWMRYVPVEGAPLREYRSATTELVVDDAASGTLRAARAEIVRGLDGMLGAAPPRSNRVTADGAIVIGTPGSFPRIARLGLDLARLGVQGYLIRSVMIDGHQATLIAGTTDIGALYGTFAFLRLIETRQPLDHLEIESHPRVARRVLDHWDNLDETVERGYAGESLWNWQQLPDELDPRYTDYARACASIGINGTVLTNVNAKADVLAPLYLAKVAALARVFRPYGVRVYLSARTSAPMELGGLPTADPLDPRVRAWWRAKVEEIYEFIPDFGGFLVKANSEGQPGPQDYGRTHADGANLLAEALAPHGGIVMWRAFVYASRPGEDRAKQAYDEFKPLDGKFRPNVLLQVKNGPIDFQPREPFHPLFGALPHTQVSLELQITKEYLGFATHLVYLGPLYEEVLRSDTYARGPGSTVAKVIDGTLFHDRLTGIAGVANIGSDRNWSGSIFDQANWYVFGRLAWNPDLTARAIADEWVRMTFTSDPKFVTPVVAMMMGSREAAVEYMTPLGLHHQMAKDSHYGPGPWVTGLKRADWTATYFNHADAQGIGFDRTETGSDAVAQYAPPVARKFGDPATCPETLLLWFHRLTWDYRLASGRTLWDELVLHYTAGVRYVDGMRRTWSALSAYVDPERYSHVATFLGIQQREAEWWRDASIAYFQTFSKRPLPEGVRPPPHTLKEYEAICFPFAPGRPDEQPPCDLARPPVPAPLTAAEDHARLTSLLNIDALRPGADANDPDAPNAVNYDEARANLYPQLPDPLTFANGERVRTARDWSRRRAEILASFDSQVYGRVPTNPPAIKWEVVSETRGVVDGIPVATKHLLGRANQDGYPYTDVSIPLTLTTPANASGPVPVILYLEFAGLRPRAPPPTGSALGDEGTPWQQQVLERGWGYGELPPTSIQPDTGDELTHGIIGLANRGEPRQLEDWGALRAWAWGASRALDYLQTDPAVAAHEIGIAGLSRYGKAALVAMAYDPRFAIGLIGSSGAGGAALLRRNFGERLENLAAVGEYHWMAGNFLKYAGRETDAPRPLTANDLPVDAHELIALCAPRPLFLSVGSQPIERWVDPQGMFMAAVAAGPVYRLLGKPGLASDAFPPTGTGDVAGTIAFRRHQSGHTLEPNWPAFLDFAARYLNAPDARR